MSIGQEGWEPTGTFEDSKLQLMSDNLDGGFPTRWIDLQTFKGQIMNVSTQMVDFYDGKGNCYSVDTTPEL